MTAQSVPYVFGGERNELERLLAQAEDLKRESTWLLDHLGIARGWRAADIGCGPIGVMDLLADRVGPTGHVVGIEREPRFAAMARQEIRRRGLSNVRIEEGDILSMEGAGGFDLVHERLVLINLPDADRHAVLGAMVALAKPGGVIALESWDRASLLCYPEIPAWRILDEAYRESVRATNGDGDSGRRLPGLLRQAGVEGIRTKVHVRTPEPGDPRRTHRLRILEVAKPRILAGAHLAEEAFDTHLRALAAHLADPSTLVVDQLLVQAWGRTPS